MRPGREPTLGSTGLSPGGLAAGSLVPLTRVSFLGLRRGVCPMQVDQVRNGNHMLHLPLLLFPLLGRGPAWRQPLNPFQHSFSSSHCESVAADL